MKNIKYLTLFLLCLWLCLISQPLKADEDNIFSHISLEAGLSSSTVMDIVRDSVGYVWFATPYGLNRYNGYEVESFSHDSADSLSILSRSIRSLAIGHKDDIWIGGDCGVSHYGYDDGYFVNYRLFPEETGDLVSSIIVDSEDRVWALTINGELYVLEPTENSFRTVNVNFPFSGSITSASLCDVGDDLLICTWAGLFRMNKNSYQTEALDLGTNSLMVHDVLMDKDGKLWVATGDDGLLVLNNEAQIIKRYKHKPDDPASLPHNKVRALAQDSKGNIWTGTFHGLGVLDIQTDKCRNYLNRQDKKFSLSHNSIRSIHVDKDGGVWIGTFFGGVSYYHEDNIKFRTIDTGKVRINDNVVNCISEGKDGTVWMGTNDSGIYCWNIADNTLTNHALPAVKSILPMDDGDLLVGTHWEGLIRYNPMTGRKSVYKHSSQTTSIPDNRVAAILKDSRGVYWIGTYDGLANFDTAKAVFSRFKEDREGQRLSSEGILSLHEDSRGRIWIGTFIGVNMYDPWKDRLHIFPEQSGEVLSLANTDVVTIFEDSRSNIWLGSSSGLYRYNENSGGFENFAISDNIGRNSICSIMEDSNHNLWLSTGFGLVRFNPQTGVMQNFTVEDGLQGNQFNTSSSLTLPDGRMLFGGVNGVTYFSPDRILHSKVDDHVLFTELYVNDRHIRKDDGSGILQSHLLRTDRLRLHHDQDNITIKFSTINFGTNNGIVYEYMLKGQIDKWRELSGNKISLYELKPGDYTLCVRVSPSSSGDAHNHVSELGITILPPWWATWQMIILYILLAATIIFLVIRDIREKIKVDNELKVEKMKQKEMEELQNKQMQFFVNISHEFKTPLTLIISPLEKLMDSMHGNEMDRRRLAVIHENAKLLLSLIGKLMSFRKAENGQLQLHVIRRDIVMSLSSIYGSFYNHAREKQMVYEFDVDFPSFEIYYDRDILERICFNFLSNAFKFTSPGDRVTLHAEQSGEYFRISVEDTGRGIPEDRQQKVFERFYCGPEDEMVGGTGIGLAYSKLLAERHHGHIELKSEVGKGSTFTFCLPLSESVYTENEKSTGATDSENLGFAAMPETESAADVDEVDTNDPMRPNILLVDDNVHMTAFLKSALAARYRVDVAHDGQEALEMVENSEEDYELILCDVMMPKMNGIVFCRKMKQNINTSHIPLILLSAKSDVEDQIEGLEMGADDYLPKPFSVKLLESKIRNAIGTRRRLKELYQNFGGMSAGKTSLFAADQELLDRATAIIEEHLADSDFSVEFLASEMCMSRSNLHLKFKAITGESISDFIRNIRLGKAVELLEEGRYNMSEISAITGFSTPSYFSRIFKKQFGYQPTEYKRHQ